MRLTYTIETSASGKVRAQIRKPNDRSMRVLKLGDWRETEDEAKTDAIKMAMGILRGTETAKAAQFQVTPKALNPDRLQSAGHPWNRGFPNNKQLRRVLGDNGPKKRK